MRRFSLRGIVAAVALALQALTAVYAFGAPPAVAHGRGDSAYCAAIGGSSDRRAPAGSHKDAGACLACQGCLGGFSPFLPYSTAGHSPNRRSVVAADWTPGATFGFGFELTGAQWARAPPARD
ncbi:hypothetical protein IY145_18395 [Methylosinus sp. H3A]|uniref:hypothetical protein n=1 Tax=Methylosinus sp. H3A TaxID=2785786 RepID=UPI0018C2E577|nr:hypothetical protein [Methylosinus sp. H3A]MBG0811324.1 hypothetical protein [Methylosinus sp. H3A]